MALMLKRKFGQGFKIGEGDEAVWIYVNPVQVAGKVSLAVIAPGKKVLREELLEEKGPLYKTDFYRPEE